MSKRFRFPGGGGRCVELIAGRAGATIAGVMRDLFAYGSLQLPAVMAAVAKQYVEAHPAILDGYRRTCLHGLPYPGIRRSRAGSVCGILYRGLGRLPCARLDRFEDAFYQRRSVQVRVLGGAVQTAEAYVVAPAHYRRLASRPWSLSRFRRYVGKAYLRRCRRRRIRPAFSGHPVRAVRDGESPRFVTR